MTSRAKVAAALFTGIIGLLVLQALTFNMCQTIVLHALPKPSQTAWDISRFAPFVGWFVITTVKLLLHRKCLRIPSLLFRHHRSFLPIPLPHFLDQQ